MPSPPPLRTVHAPFDAYGSSIEQRLCGMRPGTAPPAHDTPCETRAPHWPWGQPGRYCGRAGYRDRRGLHQRALPPLTVLHRPPKPVGCRFASANTRGKSARFRAGFYLNPYPARYRPAFAFSLVLYPPPRRLTLRLACPRGRTTGLPRCIAGILVD